MVWKKALYCRRSSFDGLPDEYLLLMPWYGPRLVQLETRLYIHWMKDFLQKALRFVQNAITDGKYRFQVILFFTGKATDNDNTVDIWTYSKNTVDLDVTYIP